MVERYEVQIKGCSPLIWNRMTRENQLALKKVKKTELDDYELKNWVKKAEINDKDEAIIPTEWLKSMLINASKQSGVIPSFAKKKNDTYTRYIGSCVIDAVKPVCKKKDLKDYGAYLSAMGKAGGGKIWRVRPSIPKWETTFTFIDAMGKMNKQELKEILDYGGMFVGIGDSRIQSFGRFEVKSIVKMGE